MKRIILLFFLLLFSLPVIASYGNGVQLMGVKIKPSLESAIGYDDNILLEAENIQKDTFWRVTPSIAIETLRSRNKKILINYTGDYKWFKDYSSEDDDSHDFNFIFEFELQEIYGSLKERYINPPARDGILFTNLIERNVHEPEILLGLDLNGLSLETAFQYQTTRYKDDSFETFDHDIGIFKGSLIFHTFSKTDIFCEWNYAEIEYPVSKRDGSFNQAFLGIKGQISPRISGVLKAGFQNRDYLESNQQFENVVIDMDLIFQFSESVFFEAGYIKTAEESVISGNNFYKIKRLDAAMKIETLRGYIFQTGGYAEQDTFPFYQDGREDQVYHFFLKTGYQFREQYQMLLNYEFLKRDSDYSLNEYEQNTVSLSVTLSY